ncbi:MAG: STAS/SEC14 domain-containing protein [Polyangiales bacterium]
MIELIHDVPERVLALKASGEVTARDYQDVLVPALEEKLSKIKKVRLLYVLDDDFEKYTGSAAWEDTKVGMKHLTAFDRVAIVTGVDWVENMVKALGFAMPGEVRVFDNDELPQAREWVSEPAEVSDLRFELLTETGVLVLEPKGELEAGDFERVAAEVDPYISEVGGLRGLMIVAEHFPGWDDFSALTSHLRFVREHHRKIRKIAFVTDDRLLSVLPRISAQFLVAESRAFPMAERDEALLWVGGE